MPPKARDPIKRFWENVGNGSGHPSGCWIWTSHRSKSGYGRHFAGRADRRTIVWVPAHRVSWTLHNGEIPEGMMVLHSCDNRACVNPDHLFLGTHGDNMRDRNAKDRQAKGEGHGRSKLDESLVRKIRALHASGLGHKRIAKIIGVNASTVARALKGLTWKHVQQ